MSAKENDDKETSGDGSKVVWHNFGLSAADCDGESSMQRHPLHFVVDDGKGFGCDGKFKCLCLAGRRSRLFHDQPADRRFAASGCPNDINAGWQLGREGNADSVWCLQLMAVDREKISAPVALNSEIRAEPECGRRNGKGRRNPRGIGRKVCCKETGAAGASQNDDIAIICCSVDVLQPDTIVKDGAGGRRQRICIPVMSTVGKGWLLGRRGGN